MIRFFAIFMLVGLCCHAHDMDLRWRGFNLVEMCFYSGKPTEGFRESDFRMMQEWGFNFVRIPLDYRFWLKDGQWDAIDEAKLVPLDRCVALGKKYHIHVQLCLHRIPGYTVAKPAEARDLFTDEDALRVAGLHWRSLAKRYKGIPSSELSFDLLNEPTDQAILAENYERVATTLVNVIRAEDPRRRILTDGLAWGTRPVPSLFKLGIGQATRGYLPMTVSHYRASWVELPEQPPMWPPQGAVSPLYGEGKKPLDQPLTIDSMPAGRLILYPSMVSGPVILQGEGAGRTLFTLPLEPGKQGRWTNVVFRSEWQITQGRCLSEYFFDIPAVERFTLRVSKGDWVGLSKLVLEIPGRQIPLYFREEWGKTNGPIRFQDRAFQPVMRGEDYVRQFCIEPWREAIDKGIFVMVGEFGAYQYTPHPMTLQWMEDCLKMWKEQNWGWALWNFRGSFGILDSGRKDVRYEDYQGHRLDRQMLELLRRY